MPNLTQDFLTPNEAPVYVVMLWCKAALSQLPKDILRKSSDSHWEAV